jgi:hypothetical protein
MSRNFARALVCAVIGFGLLTSTACKKDEPQSSILLSLSILYNHPQTGTGTGEVELQILDSGGNPVADATKAEAAGVATNNPVTNTDELSISFPKATGVTYKVTMIPCTITNGTGSVTEANFPTVDINCP